MISGPQFAALEAAHGPVHAIPSQLRERLMALDTPYTQGLAPSRRARRVDQVIDWALRRRLRREEALQCYGALALRFGPAFHHSPGVARVLAADPDPDAAAPRLARSLTGADWALIRRRAADRPSWTGEEDWSR